jgi:hypothetical protein
VIKKGSIVRRVSGASLRERLAFYSIPEPNSGCQLWLGSVDRKGYGQLRFGGRLQAAHRLAWEIANGPIPAGQGVLHRCDNPACVNLAHLRTGTPKENTADMMQKGRHDIGGLALGRDPPPGGWPTRARGERMHFAKLTEADVRAIRSDARGCHKLAKQYGVGPSTIKSVRARRTWRHV